jgi:hypothetical protein
MLPMEVWKFRGNELKIHLLELFNRLNFKLNPICHLLALLGAHNILHVSKIMVNKIIDKNQMSQEWETGMVINIHKKGIKRNCENYRGITLLSTVYKLFANIKN